MVDWRLAERVAEAVAGGDGGRRRRWPAARTSTRWPRAPRERVSEYARIAAGGAAARRWRPSGARNGRGRTSRRWAARSSRCSSAWAAGPLQSVGGVLIGVEAGGIVGFMGRNVLGQYELALLDPERPPRLLLVAPNLREAARTFEADEAELLEWVVFHEITHAVQFTGVPWLREHLAAMLRELLSSVKVEVDPTALLRLPKLAGPARGVGLGARGRARARGRRARAQGDHRPPPGGRWRSSRATPSTSWTPPARDVLPSLPKLRESLERRRREKPPLVKLLERLLGLDLKMRQYVVGKRFCDAVVARLGDRGPQPRLERARAAADARRARRSGRLGPQNTCSFCNTGLLAVYKHVFAWYRSRRTRLELTSLASGG